MRLGFKGMPVLIPKKVAEHHTPCSAKHHMWQQQPSYLHPLRTWRGNQLRFQSDGQIVHGNVKLCVQFDEVKQGQGEARNAAPLQDISQHGVNYLVLEHTRVSTSWTIYCSTRSCSCWVDESCITQAVMCFTLVLTMWGHRQVPGHQYADCRR